MKKEISAILLSSLAIFQVAPVQAQANNNVTSFVLPPTNAQSSQAFSLSPISRLPLLRDSARALMETQAANARVLGQPGASSLDPKLSLLLAAQGMASRLESLSGVAPANSGTSNHPYTTARVANFSVNTSIANSTVNQPVTGFPYNAAGKLWMSQPGSTNLSSVCSGSLIGPGLVVTAAHCVSSFGRGSSGIVGRAVFIPSATSATNGPYGVWNARSIVVPTPYLNGTDTCTVRGVVCNNDIALIELSRQSGTNLRPYDYPPVFTYSYGWNGYGDVPFLGRQTNQLTQLGYPVALDGGARMIRTDSLALNAAPNNYIIGSAQTGGSSGGPWLVNFGTAYAVGSGASPGRFPIRNVVQATTSWGFTNPAIQEQGASKFGQNTQFPAAAYGTRGAGNIGALVQFACDTNGGRARGACF